MGRKCFVSLTAAAQGAELRKSPPAPSPASPPPAEVLGVALTPFAPCGPETVRIARASALPVRGRAASRPADISGCVSVPL